MISKLWFAKKIYPIFIYEIKKINEQEKSIVTWNNSDDFLKVMIVFKDNFILIEKKKNAPLKIEKIILPQKMLLKTDFIIPFKELKNYIYKMKKEGVIVDSQHIIEFVNNSLRDTIRYYNLSRQDISNIFKEIIIFNKDMFKNNPPALVMENPNNTWID